MSLRLTTPRARLRTTQTTYITLFPAGATLSLTFVRFFFFFSFFSFFFFFPACSSRHGSTSSLSCCCCSPNVPACTGGGRAQASGRGECRLRAAAVPSRTKDSPRTLPVRFSAICSPVPVWCHQVVRAKMAGFPAFYLRRSLAAAASDPPQPPPPAPPAL